MNSLLASTGNAMTADAAPMGSGLAKSAADVIRLRKQWQELYSLGETELQFREWLDSQGVQNAVLPR